MCLEWWWSVLYFSSPTKRTFAPILNGSLIIVSFSRSPMDQYSRRMSWVFSWLKIKGSRSRRMRSCAGTSPTHLRDTHVYTYMKSLYKIRTHHAETHRNTRKIKYLTQLYIGMCQGLLLVTWRELHKESEWPSVSNNYSCIFSFYGIAWKIASIIVQKKKKKEEIY